MLSRYRRVICSSLQLPHAHPPPRRLPRNLSALHSSALSAVSNLSSRFEEGGSHVGLLLLLVRWLSIEEGGRHEGRDCMFLLRVRSRLVADAHHSLVFSLWPLLLSFGVLPRIFDSQLPRWEREMNLTW